MNKLWEIAASAVGWYFRLSLLAKVSLPIATVATVSTFLASVKLQHARSEARRWQREAEQHKLHAADRKLEIDSLKLALQKQQNTCRIQRIRAERKQRNARRDRAKQQQKSLDKKAHQRAKQAPHLDPLEQLKRIEQLTQPKPKDPTP